MPHKVVWSTTGDALYQAAKKVNHVAESSGGSASTSGARHRADGGSTRVFIGGLTWDRDEQFLREMLEDCGRIVEVHIPLDPVSKHCKGIAFVTFSSASEADAAIREWNNKTVDDMTLRVSVAKAREGEAQDGQQFGVVFNRTREHNQADAARRREMVAKKREEKRLNPY